MWGKQAVTGKDLQDYPKAAAETTFTWKLSNNQFMYAYFTQNISGYKKKKKKDDICKQTQTNQN